MKMNPLQEKKKIKPPPNPKQIGDEDEPMTRKKKIKPPPNPEQIGDEDRR